MWRPGPVISNNHSSELPIPVRHSSKAVHLKQAKFVDGKITSARTGFPLFFDEMTCLQCLKDSPDSLIIASNCTVNSGPKFTAGSLSLDVDVFRSGYVKMNFSEINGPRIFFGKSESTFNGSHGAIFIVHGKVRELDNSSELLYLEYANQDHLEKIRAVITENRGNYRRKVFFSFPIQSTIHVQIIHCVQNELDMEAFRESVQVYRTTQLDTVFEPLPFHDNCNCFESIKDGDIYRGILALKLAEGTEIEGKYLVYSQCAVYNPIFLIPFIASSLTLGILLIIAYVHRKTNSVKSQIGDINAIPRTAEGWFRYLCSEEKNKHRMLTWKVPTFDSIGLGSDEMFLVGEDDDLHVEWRSKGEWHRRSIISTEETTNVDTSAGKVMPVDYFEESSVDSSPKKK